MKDDDDRVHYSVGISSEFVQKNEATRERKKGTRVPEEEEETVHPGRVGVH